jgi:hypothetical protein
MRLGDGPRLVYMPCSVGQLSASVRESQEARRRIVNRNVAADVRPAELLSTYG